MALLKTCSANCKHHEKTTQMLFVALEASAFCRKLLELLLSSRSFLSVLNVCRLRLSAGMQHEIITKLLYCFIGTISSLHKK